MKYLLSLLCVCFYLNLSFGQKTVDHVGISQTNIDLSNLTSLEQITISPTEAGKVIVRFDGSCHTSVGDRIILAASDDGTWGVNDGNTAVEAIDSDLSHQSFSHTQVYDINAGSHTFYAVAQNFVETEGTGIASIYGSLTVEFIPNSSNGILASEGIAETNIDLTNEETISQLTINPSESGKVVVRFDGSCYTDVGDRIILAASDNGSWSPNDGATSVEALNSDINRIPFSHTRVYSVNAGSHTFYATAENYVETAGTGIASIYATFTVQFIPDSEGSLNHTGISATNFDANMLTSLADININPTSPGKVIVNFDGRCIADIGDRIILAATNNGNWGTNDGNIGAEIFNTDFNRYNFSHTRVYSVTPGNQTLSAVAQNYVETAGDGFASVYGSLTVTFVPDMIVGIKQAEVKNETQFFPNPSNGIVQINLDKNTPKNSYLKVSNAQGKTIQILETNALKNKNEILKDKPNGVYYFQVIDAKNNILRSEKIVKIN